MVYINYSCVAIYNGSYLQSYVLIILSVLLFTVLKYFAEEVVIPLFLSVFKGTRDTQRVQVVDDTVDNPMMAMGTKGYLELNTVSKSDTPLPTNSQIGNQSDNSERNLSLKDAKIIFLYFQGVAALVSFALHCKKLNPNQTYWNRYQNLYGEVLNSAVLTFLISCWIYVSENENSEQKNKSRVMSFAACGLVITGLLFIPPLLTHIVPAIVVYCWIFILFFIAFVVALLVVILCIGHFVNGGEQLTPGQLRKAIEIFTRLAAIFFFQTMFNYMYIYYKVQPSTADEYLGVIYTEYKLRSQTYCLFEHIWELGSSLVFFSWL